MLVDFWLVGFFVLGGVVCVVVGGLWGYVGGVGIGYHNIISLRIYIYVLYALKFLYINFVLVHVCEL